MKTSLVEWISIDERKPHDGAYVLGAFVSQIDKRTLVFAMFYDAGEEMFRDADDVKRCAKTRKRPPKEAFSHLKKQKQNQ